MHRCPCKNVCGWITFWIPCFRAVDRFPRYSPNFDFKSYYALIGPYEKHLELEVRNKRRWMWPFANDSIVGTASFLLPTSHPLAAPSVVAHSDLENEEQNADWGSRRRKHAASRLSARSSVASSLSHTVHADEVEPEQNEWAVQAPLLNKEMNRIEGYLLFNVFWYPAVPMEFRPPTYSRREEGDEGSEGDGAFFFCRADTMYRSTDGQWSVHEKVEVAHHRRRESSP